jgi:hypothetical protein
MLDIEINLILTENDIDRSNSGLYTDETMKSELEHK